MLLLVPALAPAQGVSLTILHTNDTHGRLLPFSYPASVPPGSELSRVNPRANVGGIARRATMVKRLREELKGKSADVWLVDAGDFNDGTPFSIEYQGDADLAAMNAMQYDFGTLGNHEFNRSFSDLKKLLATFRFPTLCANALDASSGRPLTKTFEIRQVGPLKIGIFGLVTTSAARYPIAKEVKFLDEVATSREMVEALRPKVDIIIALSHAGESVDRQIAAAVPGIDVIVGGHTHSRLTSGDFVWRSDELKDREVNGTIIVQAYQWGGELGRLDLLFNRNETGAWKVDRYRARLIPITAETPEDGAIAAVVERYWKPMAARYGEVVAEAAGDFITRGDDLAHYNLFTDSIREAYRTEIEMENMGGVRAELTGGKITKGDLVMMDPFNNTVVTFRITGRRLKKVLAADRPAVSGIEYRIEKGKLTKATVGGRPIQDKRIYTGSTNSYLAMTTLKGVQGVEVKDTGKQRLDAVIEVIRKKGTIAPVYDGRRVVLD